MPEIPSDMANIYKDDLRRGTQACSVQMSHNDSWVPSGRTQVFNFAASSSDASSEADQLKGLPSDMILLQSGNGQAGFAEISYACVYAPNGIEVAQRARIQRVCAFRQSRTSSRTSRVRPRTSSSRTSRLLCQLPSKTSMSRATPPSSSSCRVFSSPSTIRVVREVSATTSASSLVDRTG
jgi:hypothetical protein